MPDRATLHLGIETMKPTATEAAAENNRVTDAIISKLKAERINEKDIRTQNVRLEPIEDVQLEKKGDMKRTKRGYQATNDLAVRIMPVEKAAVIAGQLINEGANRILQISFDICDPESRLDALRAAAVTNARRRAETCVAAAGLRLGRVIEIRPEEPRRLASTSEVPASFLETASSVPLEIGIQTLTMRVMIIWELLDDVHTDPA